MSRAHSAGIMRTPFLAALVLAPLTAAAASETITATARLKTAGGVEGSAPVTVIVERFSTDAERQELVAALTQGGSTGARDLLVTHSPIGTVRVGATHTAIKYANVRPTGDGRLITVVTATPIAYLGASLPGAPPKAGFDLGLVMLNVATSGAGYGELVPAATLRLNEQGAIVTDDYSSEVVTLSNVIQK
jgi:hypothetical protein